MAVSQTTVVCNSSVLLILEFMFFMVDTKLTIIAPARIENLVHFISFKLLID